METKGIVTCVVAECSSPVWYCSRVSGFCKSHYTLNHRHGNPTPVVECTSCGTDFVFVSMAVNGSRSYCPQCVRVRRRFKPVFDIVASCNYHNISLLNFEEIYDSQQGLCKICSCEPGSRRDTLNLDHLHECCEYDLKRSCGKCIRGLLCRHCNVMIGYYTKGVGLLVIPQFDRYLRLSPFVFETPGRPNVWLKEPI